MGDSSKNDQPGTIPNIHYRSNSLIEGAKIYGNQCVLMHHDVCKKYVLQERGEVQKFNQSLEQASKETRHNTHFQLMVLGQFHTMKMKEGESIQKYPNNAQEIRNWLASLVQEILCVALRQLAQWYVEEL